MIGDRHSRGRLRSTSSQRTPIAHYPENLKSKILTEDTEEHGEESQLFTSVLLA